MTKTAAAERLRLAELELRAAQLEHTDSLRSVERYRAAVRELELATAIAAILLAA